MSEIYRALTGDNSAAALRLKKKQRKRITEFLASYNFNNVTTNLYSLNGRTGSTKYDEFWDEAYQYFLEYEVSAHETKFYKMW